MQHILSQKTTQVQVIQQRIQQLRDKRVALCKFIQNSHGPQKFITFAYCDLEEVSSALATYKTKLALLMEETQDDINEFNDIAHEVSDVMCTEEPSFGVMYDN